MAAMLMSRSSYTDEPCPTSKFSQVTEYELQNIDSRMSPRTAFNLRESAFSGSRVEVCVYFMNELGVTLEMEDAQFMTVEKLVQLILSEDEVGLPPDAASVFALWFTSPLLEVQLKPHHIPYKICLQWPELLNKYTTADTEQVILDEPTLCFQRNVFYTKKEEMRVQNKAIVELLYEEAKMNILDGRYPCEEASYYMLSGLQARIELGCYNPDIHTLDFFRTRLKTYLPEHVRGSRWASIFRQGFNAKNGPESRVLEQFRYISSDSRQETLRLKYLEFCWTLPYYGSAFFRAQIEKPTRGLKSLISIGDRPVLVAINSEGLYVICQEENIVMLGLKYEDFCRGLAQPKDPTNPDCFPCLYVQFQTIENDKKVLKILQIFSKQAVMMDALISFFADDLKQQMSSSIGTPNGNLHNFGGQDESEVEATRSPSTTVFADALVPLTKATIKRQQSAEACICNKLNRLSLATFNEEGDLLGRTGSWTFTQ